MSMKRRSTARPPVRPPPTDGRPKNGLLAALPADDYSRLLPHLKTVPTRPKQIVHKEGELIEQVYFPNGGVFSVTTPLSDGRTIEVATIGDEGMLGVETLLTNDAVATGDTMMQVPNGRVTMLPVEAFRDEIAQRGALHDLVGRYTQVLMAQMARSTACNALHEVHHRCARWLLMTHDRMHEQDFHLSHEFLAVMLGVHRPSVSVVAATLQRAGLISYRQGLIKVLDRKGLEGASCECYALIRAQFDRLRQ
jgi:CRP-like cAMP-binding protein